jgi:nucleoside-diphosphate-sugar epimerase
MRILFTGASSFTGFWFIQQLVSQGHSVHAVCRKNLGSYEGTRRLRVEKLLGQCDLDFGSEFGSKSFLTRLKKERFDLFCHHAADAHQYKSLEFDCLRALNSNARNLRHVLRLLKAGGGSRVILTGSVFEPREGGDPEAKALSPYGLSKGLTSQIFQAYTETSGMQMGKFVIPNPFGPYEEFRFTSHLAHAWLKGQTPVVATPSYIRDNIPVDLLAKAYARFVETPEVEILRPSGFVETQGEFAMRFSKEMSQRFFLPCPIECKTQSEFTEPLKRVNNQKQTDLAWEEEKFWDQLADYYLQTWKASL